MLRKKIGDNGGLEAGNLIQATEGEIPTPDHPANREIPPVETYPDPQSDGSVTQLIDRFLSGSPDSRDAAARRIWERYLTRLLILARDHLDRRMRVLRKLNLIRKRWEATDEDPE